MTNKDVKFKWTDEYQVAFDKLKLVLKSAPILTFQDFNAPFILDTDASDSAIGAVLSQNQGGAEKVIAYASRTLSKSERKYCVTKKELFAVVSFVKYLRHLYERKFLIRTDHGSLRWLLNFKQPEAQLARWLEILSMYDMTIEHRSGSQHRNADALSRRPCNKCKYNPNWEMEKSKKSFSEKKTTHQVCGIETRSKETDNVHNETGIDDISLADLQKEDKEICLVKKWLLENIKPSQTELSYGGIMTKALWEQRDILQVQDELLYRKWKDEKGTRFQAVVPFKARRQILEYSHDHKTAGHLGVRKTLSKIRQQYYWPGLQKDVRHYIRGCEICTKSKSSTKTKRAPMNTLGAGIPMERIALDIVGELPRT